MMVDYNNNFLVFFKSFKLLVVTLEKQYVFYGDSLVASVGGGHTSSESRVRVSQRVGHFPLEKSPTGQKITHMLP